MTSIEDRIRGSLQQRAEDVEPTPELWREVDRRITRRRWRTVGAWSLAGAAAAIAAVVVVPGLVSTDPGMPEIGGAPSGGGPVPAIAVADGSGLAWLDVRTGELTPSTGQGAITDEDLRVEQIAVRPGSTPGDHDIVAVRIDRAGSASLLVDSAEPDDGDGGLLGRLTTRAGGIGSMGQLAEHVQGFVPSVAFSPDGDTLAMTVPSSEVGGGEGTTIVLRPFERGEFPDLGIATATADVSYPSVDLGEDVRIVGWSGSSAVPDRDSELYVREGAGPVLVVPVTISDGTLALGAPEPLDGVGTEVFDVEVVPGTSPRLDQRYHLVETADGDAAFEWSRGAPAASVGMVEAYSLEVTGRDASELSLDAAGDVALVGDGERLWLLRHDGEGAFEAPVALDVTASAAALFDLPATVDAAPEPDDAVVDDLDTGEVADGTDTADGADTGDGTDEEPAPGTAPAGPALPEPVLIGGERTLRLVEPDGTSTLLYEFAVEGESWVMEVAVRPGSTVDDLTAAVLTTAEGMWDLRELRVVDGEVSIEVVDPQYRPGAGGTDNGAGMSVTGPVWSPDGGSLAWLETGPDGASLRTIGWTDDGPGAGDDATDNASFGLDVGLDLTLADWVEVDDGAFQIRATSIDTTGAWYVIDLDRQADGAWARRSSEVRTRSLDIEGGVAALAGDAGSGEPVWLLRDRVVVADIFGESTTLGEVPLDLYPGDGLPTIWMEEVGDAVLVGSPNTALTYLFTRDGEVARITDAGVASTIR